MRTELASVALACFACSGAASPGPAVDAGADADAADAADAAPQDANQADAPACAAAGASCMNANDCCDHACSISFELDGAVGVCK